MAFLVFEGIDGAGKTSLQALLAKKLEAKALPFIQTKEPGGTLAGAQIRKILLEKREPPLSPLAESLLYYADRKQHIEELIKPALKKGLWVLSDRYWASTSAYQCGGRGLPESFISQLKEASCQGVEPDLWILLDLAVSTAHHRLLKDKDSIESQEESFHQRVKDYYLQLARSTPSKWLILNGENPPEELLAQILFHLSKLKFAKELF